MTTRKTTAKRAGATAVAEEPAEPKRSKLVDLIANYTPPTSTVTLSLKGDGIAKAATTRQEFRLQALSSKAWNVLLADHRPKRYQLTDNPRLDHNPDTFPYAAVAACLVEPAATADEVRALAEQLTQGQWVRLWEACLAVNLSPL